MEKYYGFRVDIDSELDPIRIDSMKDIASKIISAYDFNPDEYFIYFHQLSIEPRDEYFGLKGGLTKRLKIAELSFSVNLKQKRTGRIKLFNFLLDKAPEEHVKSTGGTDQVRYYLNGEYIAENLGFRNELVTFISKDVRIDHRKIKVSLVAYPTDEYDRLLINQPDSHVTKFDFRFEKSISLLMPKKTSGENNHSMHREHKSEGEGMGTGTVYHINTVVGAVGDGAKAKHFTNQQILPKEYEEFDRLKKELELLRSKMREEATSTNDDLAIVEIGKAIEATDNREKTKLLDHIRKAGTKALDISEKIGVSLVAAVLKQELGI